jgi:hypothetical protein
MKTFSMLALATSAFAQSAQTQGPAAPSQAALSGDQLEVMANQMRAFVPRDEFDAPPSLPSVNGRRFTYTVTPLRTGPQNLICSGFPTWGYWPQDGRLEVGGTESVGIKSDYRSGNSAMFPTGSDGSGLSTMLSFRSFTCQRTRLEGYTATNAFGAAFPIEASREAVTAIGDFAMINTSWRTYWGTQVTGDAARQLSQNVRIRFSGTLSDWAPGRPVLCGRSHRSPTVSLPIDRITDICIFKGRADLFEVIDAHTGEVLFSSPR